MHKAILIASVAIVCILAWTESSRRAAEHRIATLDASWDKMEIRPSNGCFDDPFGDAIDTSIPKRSAAHFDAAVARSRSIAVVVASTVSVLACLFVSVVMHKLRVIKQA